MTRYARSLLPLIAASAIVVVGAYSAGDEPRSEPSAAASTTAAPPAIVPEVGAIQSQCHARNCPQRALSSGPQMAT